LEVVIVVVLIVLVLAAAAGFYIYQQNRNTGHLREQFGSEYDRTVSETGKRSDAEKELKQREERIDQLEIRELTPEEHSRYVSRWKEVQANFVDRPETAINDADTLVQEVMAARGYPVGGDFERRAADLSVQHSNVVEHYRQGHAISESHQQSPRSTEELRQAMIHYRALYADLLGEAVTN
jgi:hypothetical protein